MRAIVIPEFGDAEVLELTSVTDPEPAVGELLVQVHASGVNRADLLQRRGLYPPPPGATDVPGLEFSGTVLDAGSEAGGWDVGRRVMGIVAGGGYAERLAVPAEVAVAVPENLDLTEAGAIPEVFMTAYDAVFLQAGLGAGETLLVHAVGSGVGTAALQLARRAGASVIGTSRSPGKLERAAEMGLEVGVLGGDGWREQVLEATDGRGVDVILDLVGGPYLEQNQEVTGRRGRHVVVGVPGGSTAQVDLRSLMVRRARIMGTVLRARPLEEKAALARSFEQDVLPGFVDGSLRPVVDSVFPAERVVDAHRRMEANENFGKILLSWE